MELFFQQALQELGGGHDKQRRVLLEAFPVVCDYHIATTGESTLILHHVLEITDGTERHRLQELRRISPIYGAIGVDFTCCAVAVIIFCVLVLRHKGTNNLRINKTNKKYFRA